MSSPESRKPSDIREKKPDDYVGQKVEGFVQDAQGEFPASITVKGSTFKRGFVDHGSGNIFYAKTKENASLQDMLLLDRQGLIVQHIDQNLRDTIVIAREHAAEDMDTLFEEAKQNSQTADQAELKKTREELGLKTEETEEGLEEEK
jgi:hypothetical protein